MTATSIPIYRWHIGEVEITRAREFEAALFEPAVIHPRRPPRSLSGNRTWLEPTLMDPASGLLVFAFQSTVIKTPRATIRAIGSSSERPGTSPRAVRIERTPRGVPANGLRRLPRQPGTRRV